VLKSQSDLVEHSEGIEICKSRTRELEDGFNFETFVFFHNKRKTSRAQTEADRWKEIFTKLFPDEPVPNPCEFILRIIPGLDTDFTKMQDMKPMIWNPL